MFLYPHRVTDLEIRLLCKTKNIFGLKPIEALEFAQYRAQRVPAQHYSEVSL